MLTTLMGGRLLVNPDAMLHQIITESSTKQRGSDDARAIV
jgi:hypothetical protein